MAGLGNPFSFDLGGGPTEQEQAYEFLKSAVGEGNSADGDPTETIIEAWRFARARGIVAGLDDERAVAQTWPDLATDFIPVFEDTLQSFFPSQTDDQTRRVVLSRRWTRALDASFAGLTQALQDIDPTIVIRIPGDDEGVISQSLSTPPVSPTTGDSYIVKSPGAGAWVGQVDKIAEWTGAAWSFDTPILGQITGVIDENIAVIWDGSDWVTSKVPKSRLKTRETQPGRSFEDYDPTGVTASGPAFNLGVFSSGPRCTSFPNFSDDFILAVHYPLPSGVLTETNRRVIEEVKFLLNDALPSWVDSRVFTACGFSLDQDLLDVTVFCE